MMIETAAGLPIKSEFVQSYFHALVHRFFKILPIYEENSESLPIYIDSLQLELLGCESLILALQSHPSYITLLSILQYFIDNPECGRKKVKREVFRAISICNKLSDSFSDKEVATNECVGHISREA